MNMRITPEGRIERKVPPGEFSEDVYEDIWIQDETSVQQEDFLRITGYIYAYAHRWGVIRKIFVGEEAPAPALRRGAYAHNAGGESITVDFDIPYPKSYRRYDFNKGRATWVVLVTKYTDFMLHVTGEFLHGFDAWVEGVSLYDELQKSLEKVKSKEC